MSQNTVGYFGYGSLVNPNARSINAIAVPARVSGWIRQWRHVGEINGANLCALTVARKASSEVAGVLLIEPEDKVAEVDEREEGYRRQAIEVELAAPLPPNVTATFMYVSTGEYNQWGSTEYPILRTYIDCVISGYLRTYGYEGAVEMIDTTEGWDRPILDDRAHPLYPRSVVLTESERQIIDELLSSRNIA